MKNQLRILALCLLVVSGTTQAGLFKRKPKPAPTPPPVPVVVVPVEPPPPPAPIPLEFNGSLTATPLPAALDRLQAASLEVRNVAEWVRTTKNNTGLPFLVVDKVNAQVYAFTPYAQLKATAPILLGMARGDKMLVPNDAPMSAIAPDKRITPAGRYLSWLVKDSHGKQVLSIDYDAAISMHIVVKGTPAQRRYERLASATIDDNRVSYGCINVPPGFFTTVVGPDFTPARGIVYVLPESTTAAQMFGFQPTIMEPAATLTMTTAPASTSAAPLNLSTTPASSSAAPLNLSTTPASSSAAPLTMSTAAPASSPAATQVPAASIDTTPASPSPGAK